MQPILPAQSYYAVQPLQAAPVYPQQPLQYGTPEYQAQTQYGASAYPQLPPQYGAQVYPAQLAAVDPPAAAPLSAQPETTATDLPATGPRVDPIEQTIPGN